MNYKTIIIHGWVYIHLKNVIFTFAVLIVEHIFKKKLYIIPILIVDNVTVSDNENKKKFNLTCTVGVVEWPRHIRQFYNIHVVALLP